MLRSVPSLRLVRLVSSAFAFAALALGCDNSTLGKSCLDDVDCNAPEVCNPTALVCELPTGSDSGTGDTSVSDSASADTSTPDGGVDGSADGGADSSTDAGARCGDGTLDIVLLEQCDDGNTADGDGCDSMCRFEMVGGTCNDSMIDMPLEKCDPPEVMPADGDGCNATCNLTGQVSTLGMVGASALASDNTNLYLAVRNCRLDICGIGQIDIAACNAAPGTAACDPTFISGGAGQCACGSGSCFGGPTPSPAPDVVDGPADTATFDAMESIATDGSRIWVAHQQELREIDIATGAVSTVAGARGSCAAIDGNGTSAFFHGMRGVTYWDGLVYILDGTEGVLRTYDPASGDVTTVAGSRRPDCQVTQSPPYTCRMQCDFTPCGSTPSVPVAGLGTSAVFVSPRYMTPDGLGNLYIIDVNGEAILRYNTATTMMDVLVQGSSSLPNPYVDGDAASTTIGRPRGIVSDGTSFYFGEQTYGTVRQFELSTMTTTTFVGTHGCTAGSIIGPRDGLGADTQGTPYYTSAGGGRCMSPPPGTPIFNTLFGAMSYHFLTRSIYMVDGGRLRRIE